jgi:hypothetical protein
MSNITFGKRYRENSGFYDISHIHGQFILTKFDIEI